ncbi:CLUMA_CG000133, isoform A [Clunio marinus]|uniref:Large ribosomal subunit protein mL54 n=1 Tax=Clunio marinus TaxID=568069 RepID=A0A1J1HFJ2_9DIPT|nr:CLUMA_CG000133, isoform A [Clunio marinus]
MICTLQLTMKQFNIVKQLNLLSSHRFYAANPSAALGKKLGKVSGKMGVAVEKRILPVETNPEKLVNYVCGSNIYIKGEDIKLKPDNEYPEWLWNLYTGPPKKLEDHDPETKEYWRILRKMALRRNNQLSKLKKF